MATEVERTKAETETTDLPAAIPETPQSPLQHSTAPSLMLDEKMFERAKFLCKYMADAEGFTPKHLIGKSQACFAIINLSLNWKLEPYMVARCTYQTPGGAVGFEGKLVQAILEASGRIIGGIKYEHYGDWVNVQHKHKMKTSTKGHQYAVQDWKDEAEIGLGVKVSARLIGEDKDRTLDFDLIDAWPRNSTLWAIRPKQQICYTAVRAFANLVVPSLIMGVPFDVDEMLDRAEAARDITPAPDRPVRKDYVAPEDQSSEEDVWIGKITAAGGEKFVYDDEPSYLMGFTNLMEVAADAGGRDGLEEFYAGNSAGLTSVEGAGHDQAVHEIRDRYTELHKAASALGGNGSGANDSHAGGSDETQAKSRPAPETVAPVALDMPAVPEDTNPAVLVKWRKEVIAIINASDNDSAILGFLGGDLMKLLPNEIADEIDRAGNARLDAIIYSKEVGEPEQTELSGG